MFIFILALAMDDSYSLEVSHVLLQQPPDHLLTYDYCLSKTLKCINSLKSCNVEKIQSFEPKLRRHIYSMHSQDRHQSGELPPGYLPRRGDSTAS